MDNTKEVWKNVIDYENLYQISNYGRVKSLKRKKRSREKILKLGVDKNNYSYVILHKENKYKYFRMGRLVALHFLENLNNYPQINHIDGNKQNNHISNLEWCTALQNIKHAYVIGLKS